MCKIDSEWEFVVWLRKPMADSRWSLTQNNKIM